MMRQKKKEKQAAKVLLDEMQTDNTPGRIRSHSRLTGIIAQFGDAFLQTSKESEIQRLFVAYGVPFRTSFKKVDLCRLFAQYQQC